MSSNFCASYETLFFFLDIDIEYVGGMKDNNRKILIKTPSANKSTSSTRNPFNQHLIHGVLLLIDLHLGKGISARLNIEVIRINGLALQEGD